MALFDIFTLAQTAFPTYSGNPVIHNFGPKFLMKQEAPPRVTWVPTTDRYLAPEPHTPQFTQTGKILAIEPRVIRSREAGVDIHLWGASYADTEALTEQYIAALWSGNAANLWGAFEVDSGRWIETDGREMSLFGMVYVLPMIFRIPIRLPSMQTAIISSVPTTDEFGT